MSGTELDLINAALTRTGDEPLTSLDQGSTAASIATQNYEEIVGGILSSHPWKWAAKTETLSLIAGAPAPPWTYAYTIPGDVIDLRTVMVAGMPIVYEVQADKVLCDYGSGSEVIAKYTWRPPESAWPNWFRVAVITALEPLFLRGVGERYEQAEAREKAAERMLGVAKNRDSQQQTARHPITSPALRARSGWPLPFRPPWWT